MSAPDTAGGLPVWTQTDYLRKSREHRGLTQLQLAELMGVDVRTVRNAEAGKGIRRVTILAWSMVTGVPVEWLQTGMCAIRDSNPEPADLVQFSARIERSPFGGGAA